jgi:DNA polymerase
VDIVTIDFETYYDKDYSLTKMTTEAYIRDPRFEVIGLSVKVNGHPSDWYSGDDPGKFLRSLDFSKRAILCHHTHFDGAILSWHFGIKPKLWLDTLSMAKAVNGTTVSGALSAQASYYNIGTKGDDVVNAIGMHRKDFTPEGLARYGRYCCNDNDLTYDLFKKLRDGFPVSEILIIDQTIRMFTEPMLELDTYTLSGHLDDVITSKDELLSRLDLLSQVETSDGKKISDRLMSNNGLAAVLLELEVDPPMKVSKTTGNLTYAFSKTDKAFTDLLDHDDPVVRALVAARLGVKSTIEETRTASLLNVATRGALPVYLRYYAAHTGRYGGGDKLNLQNLPARSGGNALRRSIVAPAGYSLVACDSSQIEARMLAWFAGQTDLVEAFREGRDVYSEFASTVYGRKITKADKLERFVGKTCILGLGYGMGYVRFASTLLLGQGGLSVSMTSEEAAKVVSLYRNMYANIKAIWNACNFWLTRLADGGTGIIDGAIRLPFENQLLVLPNGLSLKYTGLRQAPVFGRDEAYVYINNPRHATEDVKAKLMGRETDTSRWPRLYGAKLIENIIQALARIVVMEQMAAVGQRYKVVLQVHDEVVICVRDEEVEEAERFMVKCMSTPPKWGADIPVACESARGKNYGDCK